MPFALRWTIQALGTGFILHEGSYAAASVRYNTLTGEIVTKTDADGKANGSPGDGVDDGADDVREDCSLDGSCDGDGDGDDNDSHAGGGDDGGQRHMKNRGVPCAKHLPPP